MEDILCNNEDAVCDAHFVGCKDPSYFPNCGDCVYLSRLPKVGDWMIEDYGYLEKTVFVIARIEESEWVCDTEDGGACYDDVYYDSNGRSYWAHNCEPFTPPTDVTWNVNGVNITK